MNELENQGAASPQNPDTTSSSAPVTTAAPKHNPWADETERFTAQGPVKAAPLPKEKPAAGTGELVTPKVEIKKTVEKPAEAQVQQPAAQVPAEVVKTPTAEEIATTAIKKLREEESVAKQTQQNAPKPLSDDEFNQMFGVVKLNEQDFAAIIGFAPEKPEQVAALNAAFQKLNAQSVKMANYMADQKIKALEEKFSSQVSPIVERTKQEAEQKVESMFFEEYPGLKDYRPLLVEIKDSIVAKGTKFNSAEELINFVATKAATLIGKPVADLKRQAAGGSVIKTQQSPTATSRQMTSTLVGGRGGSGAATSTKPKSTAEQLFGE